MDSGYSALASETVTAANGNGYACRDTGRPAKPERGTAADGGGRGSADARVRLAERGCGRRRASSGLGGPVDQGGEEPGEVLGGGHDAPGEQRLVA
jgi:hypothetical protein